MQMVGRKETPTKNTPSNVAIMVQGRGAFFDSLGLKTGTPLEIASVPLMATAPAETRASTSHNVTVQAQVKSAAAPPGKRMCETLMMPTISIRKKTDEKISGDGEDGAGLHECP